MKKLSWIILIFSNTMLATAQEEQVSELVEKTAETMEMEGDYTGLVEDLEELTRKPVKINQSIGDDLAAIPFLTPAQRKALSEYLSAYGEVLSVYELRSVPGFDSSLVRKIGPFISIAPATRIPSPTPRNLARYGHHELLFRFEQSFPGSAAYGAGDSLRAARPGDFYSGSPQRLYARYTYSWFDRLHIGIAGEKDPGEQFFRGAQPYGMDFYAGYLALANTGILKTLVLGSFRASFGQGLTFGSGFSLGAVPGFSSNIPAAGGIRPALGMSEGSYLRGVAATLKVKPFEFSAFVSYHPRDASLTVTDSMSGSGSVFSSFTTTGYHRTVAEISKKNALTEWVAGGNLGMTLAPSQRFGFKAGITGAFVQYSSQLVPGFRPYNRFGFSGTSNYVTGFDFQVRVVRQYFFGEFSRSRNGGTAWLCGAVIAPDPSVTVTVICRDYRRNYQNLFSRAFGQNSLNAGEYGIYAALNATPGVRLSVAGYFDLFSFPWLRYRVDKPSRGLEAGLLLTWLAARNVTIGLKYYRKNTQVNAPAEPGTIVHRLADQITRSYRCTIEWLPGECLTLRTRVEAKEVRMAATEKGCGWLICQDMKLRPGRWPENLILRIALFDIPSYDVRIYSVEPEVLYGYSVPAYQGKGMRGCCVVKAGLGRKLDCWVRGGVTIYTDRDSVGTGPDETGGNIRGEFTAQLLWKI